MAVILHPGENVDGALRRLHREVMREKLLETARAKQYWINPATEGAEKRRAWKKTKRRRRAANRRKNV